MGQIAVVDSWGHEISGKASYEGADPISRELASWQPMLGSAAADTLDDWELLTARTRDLYRNDGNMSGAIQIHLDNIIGSELKLSAKPDWRLLGQSPEWASEWARIIESRFTNWANDPDFWIDAARQLNFGGLLNQGYRSFMTSGDICATAEWITDRPSYNTAIKMIEPDRMSNPMEMPDTDFRRGGIDFDRHGAPIRHHIRVKHQHGVTFSADANVWKAINRETPWGRRQFIHIFDQERPDQPRGVSKFAAILRKSKMLDNFDRATLQAAIVNAMYAAVIESEFDSQAVAAALGSEDFEEGALGNYLSALTQFHKGANVRFNGVKIPHLFPNESFKLTSPKHPMAEYPSFVESGLRHLASGLNISYEQLARDYSKTNYSGARAGWLETWQFFKSRRVSIPGKFASTIFGLWLEEEMDRDPSLTPPGAPDFWSAKAAWMRCKWLGPAQGNIDPAKEEKAYTERFAGNRMTYEEYFAERGQDWEEQLVQRAEEEKFKANLGLVDTEPPAPEPAPEEQEDE